MKKEIKFIQICTGEHSTLYGLTKSGEVWVWGYITSNNSSPSGYYGWSKCTMPTEE